MTEPLRITPQAIAAAIEALMDENDRLKREIEQLKETRNNQKKLTDREVSDIRAIKRSGLSNRDIADIYDLNPSTVSRIVRGHYHKGAT